MTGYEQRTGPYRSRNGAVLGVCKGLAEYFNFSLFWTRFLTVIGALIMGVWPVVFLYIILALLLKPEPVVPFESESDHEFYNSYTASKRMAVHRLKSTFDNLERRLRRLEDSITAREFDWERRLNKGI